MNRERKSMTKSEEIILERKEKTIKKKKTTYKVMQRSIKKLVMDKET